jgi:D-beta-D-heptose 7-phosphate kinase / D-beta-D-heptose 1-phosphate adenosyltransferase
MSETQPNGSCISQALPALPQDGFCDVKVLVVGDLMLDRYIDGEVYRVSPEAPVPVLSVQREWTFAGGAANVALNVAGLKAKVGVAGVIGEDSSGRRLLDLLAQSEVNTQCVMKDAGRPTTRKTRVLSGNHQIVRLDEESSEPLETSLQNDLFGKVMAFIGTGIDAVILSDYAKGVLADSFPQLIISECNRRGIPVLVDPKRRDYTAYSGATCITPNQKEFRIAATDMSISLTDIGSAGPTLLDRVGCKAVLITQGSEGMTLVTTTQCHHLPAIAHEVFDVSGAGDTVIATLSVALAAGFELLSAVEVANAAASIVVKRLGTTPIEWRDLVGVIGTAHLTRSGEHILMVSA